MNKKLLICLNLLSIILILLIINCGKENRIELLHNSSVEQGDDSPYSWRTWHSYHSATEWTTEHYVSRSHSLKISRNSTTTGYGPASWEQIINNYVPAGIELTLSLSIKLENIIGNGVSFFVMCFDADHPDGIPEAFATSRDNISLMGTKNWTRYSIKIYNTPKNIQCLVVNLRSSGSTTGTVYFDDISLSYIE